MNYEDVLGKFLQTTLDTAEKVGEFAVAQLPELVQQALNWYFAYGLIQFVAGVALAVWKGPGVNWIGKIGWFASVSHVYTSASCASQRVRALPAVAGTTRGRM